MVFRWRLLQQRGRSGSHDHELPLSLLALASPVCRAADVFILDCEEGIFQWNGSSANNFEKARANEFCHALQASLPCTRGRAAATPPPRLPSSTTRAPHLSPLPASQSPLWPPPANPRPIHVRLAQSDRGGGTPIRVLDDGEDEGRADAEAFYKTHLPGDKKMFGIKVGDIKIKDASAGGDDEATKAFVPTLYRLSGGKTSRVARMKQPPISKLNTSGIYLLDTGFELVIWVGKASPSSERATAFVAAQQYLKR